MNTVKSRLARLALIVMVPVLLASCGINNIPTKEERAKAQWAEVQNQYQRRADLIPNLVATVKGYAAQESSVLIGVTQARAAANAVKADASILSDPAAFQRYQQAQNQLSVALTPLRVLQENYPDLKSNTNFLALQSQLEGTENRITISRRDYNESVRDYNLEFKTFPNSFWAGFHKASKPMVMFEANAGSQNAPTVDFAPAAPAVNMAPAAAPATK